MHRFELEPSEFTGDLASVRMQCDKPLTTKRNIKVFPNKSFSMAITGPPGSGKTSFCLSLFKKPSNMEDAIYYKVFKDILYVCPPDSRASAVDSPLGDLPSEMVFDDLTYDVEDVVNRNRKRYEEDGKPHCQLLIVDDLGQKLKSRECTAILANLMFNRRHKSLSIILLTQYTVSIPKQLRAQLSHVCLFHPSRQDVNTVRTEYTDLDKDTFAHLSRFTFKDRHDMLYIDRDANQYYKNLQRIQMS